jgi:hypothetical protein
MGTGVSRAVARKPSGASDGKVSRADLAGRAKAAGEVVGKPAGVGVLLTSPPLLEYSVPTYEVDGLVTPLEGQRVKGSLGDPVGSVGVAAVVGVDGVLGGDIRVLYPLIVFWAITLPLHHVPEAAVADLCFEDLGDLPPLVSVRLEDGQRLIVLRASGEWVWLRKLKLHNWKDQMELGIARQELELVHTLSHNLHDLEVSEPFV